MTDNEWTKILGWPGYRVYRSEINEATKTLCLWVRRKRGNRKLVCSGCGRRVRGIVETYEREVRDLPCFEYRTTVVIELCRVGCPDCGIKSEQVEQLPSKAPFSKRFETIVGQACENAAGRRVAQQFGLAAPVRYEPSTCGISGAGPQDDGNRRCGTWALTKSIWARSTSSSRW